MLQIHSKRQVTIGLSKGFGIIRFKNVQCKQKQFSRNFGALECSKIYGQTIFWYDCYTKSIEINLHTRMEPIKLPGKPKIKSKLANQN